MSFEGNTTNTIPHFSSKTVIQKEFDSAHQSNNCARAFHAKLQTFATHPSIQILAFKHSAHKVTKPIFMSNKDEVYHLPCCEVR